MKITSKIGFGILAILSLLIVTQGWNWSWVKWGLLLAYLPSYFDGSENTAQGRYWDWFARHPIWKRVYSYFPARIFYEVDLDPTKQYIFASHPHGVLSIHHGMYLTNGVGFHDDCSPGENRRDVAANILFRIPFWRDIVLWLGGVSSPISVIRKVLSSGMSVGVLVGGMNEQMLAKQNEQTVFILKRKGFCKLALEVGAPIVPCYCFGETQTHKTYQFALGFRTFLLKKLRIALPFFCGDNPLLFWLPRKIRLETVVGAPIPVQKLGKDASKEEMQEAIDKLHAEYVRELENLFERHKEERGYGDSTLTFV